MTILKNSSRRQFREHSTSKYLLYWPHLDLRLLAHRGGEANLYDVVTSFITRVRLGVRIGAALLEETQPLPRAWVLSKALAHEQPLEAQRWVSVMQNGVET